MLQSQKIQLRQSEIRQRLNTIAGMAADQVTDEIRTESTGLRKELDGKETEFRAAVEAEETETRQRAGQYGGDGEAAEFRALCGKVRLGRYLGEIAGGAELGGDTPEAEMRAALKIPRGLVPWAAFDPGEKRESRDDATGEKRADTATAAPASIEAQQDEILGRVFAPTAAMFAGVDMRTVDRGDAVYPVITAGQDAATKAKGDAQEAGAATITSTTLDRRRATARYIFRLEDSAGMGETLEMSLRSDMIGAIGEAIDQGVLMGDGAAPNPSGFLDTANGPLTIPADPGAASTFADVVEAAADAVDGRFAVNLSQVRLLMNGDGYGLAASTFASGAAVSGADYLMRYSGGIRASANMPATASNIALGLAYRSGAMGASAVMPTWQGVQVFRDEATRIAQGEIALTAVALYNFAVLRAGAYAAFKLDLS